MSEALSLTAAEAAERIRAAEPAIPPSCGTATASAPPRTTSTRSRGSRRTATPPRIDRESPLAGVPVAVKDLFCTEGVPSQAG